MKIYLIEEGEEKIKITNGVLFSTILELEYYVILNNLQQYAHYYCQC